MTWMEFADFLLSEWLWNVTLGWYHIPFNILFMVIFLKIISKFNIIPAVFMSIFANLYAFAVYSLFTIGVLMHGFNLTVDPNIPHPVVDKLHACLYLGLIYIVIQMTFFFLISFFYKLSLFRALLVLIASNMLSALAVYWLLPM